MTTRIETPNGGHEVDPGTRGGRVLGAMIVAAIALAAATVMYMAGGDGGVAPVGDDAGMPLADGTHEAWLRVTTDGGLEVDLVEVLSGQEAVDAAHEDGELPESEDSLPNDIYVRNSEVEWVTIPLAADAELELYDCATGCELIAADVEDLLTGTVTPYGGPSALFELTMTGGEVTQLAEAYLP